MSGKPKRPVLHTDPTGGVTLVYHLSEEEYKKLIAVLKNGKTAGIYDALMVNNICSNSHKWLLHMLNKCFTDDKVPGLWRQSMIRYTETIQTNITTMSHVYAL